MFLMIASFSLGLCISVVSNYTTRINPNAIYLTVEAWNDAKWTRDFDNKTWMFLYEPSFGASYESNYTYPHFPFFSINPSIYEHLKGSPILTVVCSNTTDFTDELEGMLLNATAGTSYFWEGTPGLMIDILVANSHCVLLEFRTSIVEAE